MKMYPSNKIELKSVYLTWKTWDLTERWNENETKYTIELNLCN